MVEHHRERQLAAGGDGAQPRVPQKHPAPTAPTSSSNGNKPAWLLEPEPGSRDPRPEYDVRLHADKTSTVTIAERAVETIERFVARSGWYIECGGSLVGIRDRTSIFVTDAGGGAGKGTASTFTRDHEHDVLFAHELEKWTAGATVEAGFWHSHPASGSDRPSHADLQHFAGMAELLDHAYLGVIITPPPPGSDSRRPILTAWVCEVCEQPNPDITSVRYRVERAVLKTRR